MIESIVSNIVYAVIPQEYMPLAVIVLTAFLAIEQWLASTKRIQANSTLQLIVGIANKVLNHKTAPGEPPASPQDQKPSND